MFSILYICLPQGYLQSARSPCDMLIVRGPKSCESVPQQLPRVRFGSFSGGGMASAEARYRNNCRISLVCLQRSQITSQNPSGHLKSAGGPSQCMQLPIRGASSRWSAFCCMFRHCLLQRLRFSQKMLTVHPIKFFIHIYKPNKPGPYLSSCTLGYSIRGNTPGTPGICGLDLGKIEVILLYHNGLYNVLKRIVMPMSGLRAFGGSG